MGKAQLLIVLVAALVLTLLGAGLLTNIAERKAEADAGRYVRVVEVSQDETDPAVWGRNFRGEYESWSRTERTAKLVNYVQAGRYGGSEPHSKLDKDPALKRLFAGYPFAIDYNEEQGHGKALEDLLSTKRLGDNKPGACLTCKTPAVPQIMKTMGAEKMYATPLKELVAQFDPKHSVSCGDCHDANTMALVITRPAFTEAMAARGIDVSKATRQEMRTYVCAQCHVEYYFEGPGKKVVYPWKKGLKVDDIQAYYDEINFKDWDHAETKAALLKMQHPEFEMWSTGIHARAGVACADCHMSYKLEGATKISDHWVRSPLTGLTNSCMTCHRVSEEELRGRVLEIQDRTFNLEQRAEKALVEAQDALKAAMDRGVSDEALKEARQLQRQSFTRVDFVAAENSMGFHSPQEAVRILGDAIDFARQAQLSAQKAMQGQTR